MARIVSVDPGSGRVDDKIQIEVEYDPTGGGTPDVGSVIFYEGVDAPRFNVVGRDSTNRTLTIDVVIPAYANTGFITVDLIGITPIRTVENFTVIGQNDQPLRIQRLNPVMPNGGYYRGTALTFILTRNIDPHSVVYFPNTRYGPPVYRPPTPPRISGNQLTVTIPAQAQLGRVKIQDGNGPDSALTNMVLTFQ
jgi:hypothetical protein